MYERFTTGIARLQQTGNQEGPSPPFNSRIHRHRNTFLWDWSRRVGSRRQM